MEKIRDIINSENFKLISLTIFYLLIMIVLFWIYAGGSASNDFIYNEF
ncbi:teichoic acid D-Ala incorporation-associated protein DltX [Mammaliicoccus sciuri]|nr:teichoic acid D-Ala incorporation-associated protein DltX [Mammaliicoccus sciuri]MCD8819686.1 teichoic acid D-Ala incorporation-associated protein DltX [Mammaliicoccus sciuri]